MNGELPPVDPDLRAQLARRAAGRTPEGALAEVYRALDGMPAPRVHAPWLRPAWRTPHLVGAGMGLVLVAILAVAVVVPAFHSAPLASYPGYPADRPLTAVELAAVMAGPALPTNTALVASVTIDSRMDVCPMNRYPTVGVIEDMGSQVCVMGYGLADRLTEPKATGVFAFRYLGPGYLGLLGEIAPASNSRVAYAVTHEWPLAGKAFLVEGWLGAEALSVTCVDVPTAGDVLYPEFADCGFIDWLSTESAAPLIDPALATPAPGQTADALALRGNARAVAAGGMRIIDGLDHATPVHGVFVVRADTTGCPGASPADSRGCSQWHVLARVADLAPPLATPSSRPTETPTDAGPPATPIAEPTATLGTGGPTGLIGPGNRALTQAELATLVAADPKQLTGRYVIDERVTCETADCAGVAPAALADTMLTDGKVALVGPVNVRSDGGLVWTVPQALASDGMFIYIVDAWISGAHPLACDDPTKTCDTWLGSENGREFTVQSGAYLDFAPQGDAEGAPRRGLFLVERIDKGKTCGTAAPASAGQCSAQVEVLARLEAVPPSALATDPIPSASEGVVGPAGRPLTTNEFENMWAADPAHLAGRIAIVKGPVAASLSCLGEPAAGGSAACQPVASTATIAPEGYWVIRVAAGGKLSKIAPLALPVGGGFVFSVNQMWMQSPSFKPDGTYCLIDGWLQGATAGEGLMTLASSAQANDGVAIALDPLLNDPTILAMSPLSTSPRAPLHRLYLEDANGTGGGLIVTSFESANP
jgi:hypothetical protein